MQGPLAKTAGGWGLCRKGDKPVFADTNDPDYRALLENIEQMSKNLYANPRYDMRPVSDWCEVEK